MVVKWFAVLSALIALGVMTWASDKIGYEGERTVYSVRCEQGIWEGWRCTGRLVAGDRYRFRASRSRREVLYWIVGSSGASGKYADCEVFDRGNWTCTEAVGQVPTITHEMVKGHPTHDGDRAMLPFHAVPKWQWWLLNVGVPATNHATD
jgi:hypothetical protein